MYALFFVEFALAVGGLSKGTRYLIHVRLDRLIHHHR
jgi:hypothetical protein